MKIYNPVYTTSQFLNDNNLKTAIGGLVFPAQNIKFVEKHFLFEMPVAFIALSIYRWLKQGSQQNDNSPKVKFTFSTP